MTTETKSPEKVEASPAPPTGQAQAGWDGLTRHRVFRAQHFLLHMVALEMRTEPEKVLKEVGLERAIAYISEHLEACMLRDQPAAVVALFADALAQEEPRLKGLVEQSRAGAAESLAAFLVEHHSAKARPTPAGPVERLRRRLTSWQVMLGAGAVLGGFVVAQFFLLVK